MEFSLSWKSEVGHHNDRLYIGKIDFWRDFFPHDMGERVAELQPGESFARDFAAGELVPPHAAKDIVEFKSMLFEREQGGLLVDPRRGRYYPQGFAATAMNCFRGNFLPFRLLQVNEHDMTGDKNHPLSRYPLSLSVTCHEKLGEIEEHGGVSHDIAEETTARGPGMQLPAPGIDTDFYDSYPFSRKNSANDSKFYQQPRLLQHLDDKAIAEVSSLYRRLLQGGSRVLDLMTSNRSHLPDTLSLQVSGLGMNSEEMRQNPQLDDLVNHDLNANPEIPYADSLFDAVLCASSIEYLVDPHAVMRQVARVLKPGGVFIVTFSERWFPGKEIQPWSEMHPFERQGLVLDYFLRAAQFDRLHTESIRGYPRPVHDKYAGQMANADPVFAVWGYRNDQPL